MPLVIQEREDELYHYGKPHEGAIPHSGRYPYGSGDDAYQRIKSFGAAVEAYKKDFPNATEAEIAKAFNMKHVEYRARMSNLKEAEAAYEYSRVKRMRDQDQMSFQAIADELGLPGESSARNIYKKDDEILNSVTKATADKFKERIDETGGFLDVGKGVEAELGISETKKERAIAMLKDQGYEELPYRQEQITNPGKYTTMRVLCPPGTDYKELYNNQDKLVNLKDYHTEDGGETFTKLEYPASMNSKRLKIRYAEDGGKEQDGVIEIRRGVSDLSLGDSRYAQVRILVDDKMYLKGMARYSDDIPDGYDVVFNTNKSKSKSMEQVLKPIKEDNPDNPFGSLLKANGQSHYIDPTTGEKKLSLINKTREEGDWEDWSKTLPSQFLAKQSEGLINKQLNLSIANKQAEYDEIMQLTNPVVKKAMLKSFADDCDTTAVHLYAAGLPRQKYQVILPVTSMKENEVFAPNYKNGETVALVRYPHAGTFEIPIVTVNNNQKDGKKIIGNAKDAVGISSKVAERLSGADFDGDTVMVIPCNKTANGGISKVQVSSRNQLKDLVGFDPQMEYPERPGMKYLTKQRTQNEMGQISNLITDMTLAGANDSELARAVKHSMVVIDATKHKLDYKRSEADNDIKALKKKYQLRVDENGKTTTGAATIVSRAKSPTTIVRRKGSARIDKETGKLVYYEDPTEYTVTTKTGKVKTKRRTQASNQMSDTDDAFTLVRDRSNPKEVAYANYANKLKAMANNARKEMMATKGIQYDSEANKKYKAEEQSLKVKVNNAKKNHPRERKAQSVASIKMKAVLEENPALKEDKEHLGKVKQQLLASARKSVGSTRPKFDISDREWEAIQAGAISSSFLNEMINYVGVDKLAARATPKSSSKGMSQADINKIHRLWESGSYSASEIAEAMGCSTSTVWNKLKDYGT